jgi:hypothetical protein
VSTAKRREAWSTAKGESTPLGCHSSENIGHIHTSHASHTRAIHATILVDTHVVPFSPLWIGKNGVGFHYQLEFLLIASLDTRQRNVVLLQRSENNLVWMVL